MLNDKTFLEVLKLFIKKSSTLNIYSEYKSGNCIINKSDDRSHLEYMGNVFCSLVRESKFYASREEDDCAAYKLLVRGSSIFISSHEDGLFNKTCINSKTPMYIPILPEEDYEEALFQYSTIYDPVVISALSLERQLRYDLPQYWYLMIDAEKFDGDFWTMDDIHKIKKCLTYAHSTVTIL